MNAEFEHELRTLRLATPSPELDRRVAALLAPAEQQKALRHSIWQLSLFGAMAATTAIMMIGLTPQPSTPVVYHLEPTTLMRHLLNDSPASQRPLPQFSVSFGSSSSPHQSSN